MYPLSGVTTTDAAVDYLLREWRNANTDTTVIGIGVIHLVPYEPRWWCCASATIDGESSFN